MTKNVIAVEIRSEFKKGFGDVAKSLSALEKQFGNIAKLTESVNKLTATMDKHLALTNANKGLKKAVEQQTQLNKTSSEGARIAQRHESAYTKLNRQLRSVNAAQKSGHITAKAAQEAEIGLLNEYIKKTKDLGVLEAKNGRLRDKGRFTGARVSSGAISAVRMSIPVPTEKEVKVQAERVVKVSQAAVAKALKEIEGRDAANSLKRSNSFFNMLFPQGPRLSDQDRSQLQSFYRGLYVEADRMAAEAAAKATSRAKHGQAVGIAMQSGRSATMGIQDLINRNTGVTRENNPRHSMYTEGLLRKQESMYAKLAAAAERAAGRIRRINFAPNAARAQAGIDKMINSYTKLGHVLFQLQYSTITLFTATGAAAIVAQVDKFITLRNQIVRTSESVQDYGKNMAEVFKISKETFSDANVVGNMYSRINKYRDALKLTQEEVGGITQAIAGAFSASPGNAQEKSASMYQFMQGFQSNRMGGDELRSVLEMAPFVGDILGKGLAKIRGMPEGSVVDLRKQGEAGTPVNSVDLAKIFSDPEIQAEIKKTLGQQARTFGDLLQVGKTRIMEFTQRIMHGSTIFDGMINLITRFLTNDEAMNKFFTALQIATTALIVYGGTVAARGAGGMIGNATGVLANAAGMGSFGARRGFIETQRKITGTASAIGGGVSNATTLAVNGLTTAMTALRNPVTLAKNGITGLVGVFGKLKNIGPAPTSALGKTAANMGLLSAAGRGLGSSLLRVLTFMVRLNVPIGLVVTAIGYLIVRFNQILGKTQNGMNLMDVMLGLWDKFIEYAVIVGDKIDDLSFGLISKLGSAIDWVLEKIGKAAANLDTVALRSSDRQFGGTDRELWIKGDDGNTYRGIVGSDNKYRYQTDESGKRIQDNSRTADIKWGESLNRNVPTGLPSGQQANLPGSGGSGNKGDKGRKDPWPEFIRDLRLKIQAVNTDFAIAEPLREIMGEVHENQRKAMDVMNFDSSGFDNLGQAWTAFSTANAQKATEVNQWNDRLKQAKLAEASANFVKELEDRLNEATRAIRTAGMDGLRADRYNARYETLSSFASGAMNRGDLSKEDYEHARKLISEGQLALGEEVLRSNLTAEGQQRLTSSLETADRQPLEKAIVELTRKNMLAREYFDLETATLGLFGRHRELATEINAKTQEYVETYGIALHESEELQAQLQKEIDLIREKAERQRELNANWRNGIRESITAYKEDIENFGTEVGNAMTNGLKGLEDGLTNLITTGKMDLHAFITQIQADVARLFVRQTIMKPLTNMLEGWFGGNMTDQVIQARNVYVNGKAMEATTVADALGGKMGDDWRTIFNPDGQEIGQEMAKGMENAGFFGKLGSIFGSLFGGGGGGGSTLNKVLGTASKVLSFIPFFHSGGTVGDTTMGKYMSPSVFAGARRYHTGGTVGMPSLAVGEVPAILKQGEKVLTASQYSAMNSGGSSTTFAPNISLNYTAAPSGGEKASPEEDAKAISKMVNAAVNEALLEYDKKSRRPGNPAYLQNRR